MRHCIYDVVYAEAIGQACKTLSILRVIRVLPRIAPIHVVIDRHDQSFLIVVDASPVRRETILALPRDA